MLFFPYSLKTGGHSLLHIPISSHDWVPKEVLVPIQPVQSQWFARSPRTPAQHPVIRKWRAVGGQQRSPHCHRSTTQLCLPPGGFRHPYKIISGSCSSTQAGLGSLPTESLVPAPGSLSHFAALRMSVDSIRDLDIGPAISVLASLSS